MTFTVEEETGAIRAICDGCGEVRLLDVVLDDEPVDMVAAIEAIGWVAGKPERVMYPISLSKPMTFEYPQDFCPDCQSDEPAPKPLIVNRPPPRAKVADAFANDPHDTWPIGPVFKSLGLRETCGHPIGNGVPCEHCKAGQPVGRIVPWWKR